MYDKHIVVDGTLRAGGGGFQVDLRIPYYRGLGLSMVSIPAVIVDGVAADLSDATFAVHGEVYRLADLAGAADDRWGFTEAATLTVPGRVLAPGEHDIEVLIDLRISYMPVPTVTRARKTLELSS